MTCVELKNLVKAYTNGELPLEIYREQRREIVEKFAKDTPEPSNKNDPLASFPEVDSKKSAPSANKSIYIITAAVGTVVLGIAIALFLFSDETDPTVAKTEDTSDSQTYLNKESKTNAQRHIEKFLAVNLWDEQNINQLILDWQILSSTEKQQARSTKWFEGFKLDIQKRLDQQNPSSKGDTLNESLLNSLLATLDPSHFIHQPFFTQESTSTPEEIEKLIDKAPSKAAEVVTEVMETKVAKAKLERTPVAVEPVDTKVTKKQQPKPTSEKVAPQKTKKATQVAKIDPEITKQILSKFTQSFEEGNVKTLIQLFSTDATTNHHTSAKEIGSSYAELFQTTAKRDLEFSAFSWKQRGTQWEGSGKYLAHLNPKGTNIDQVFTADVTIVVNKLSDAPLITGLYLTNQKFSTSLREEVKKAIPVARKLPPPDKDELRVLLKKFVASYNRGDIDSLMVLFSQEARTNDRNNFNEIRLDYEELFQTTSSRNIVLKNLTWDFSENIAVASGLFEVKIQPKASKNINIYKGKIRISATKYEGGVLITQLLHNTQ